MSPDPVITLADLDGIQGVIADAVAHLSDDGRAPVDRVEAKSGFDLGTDLLSPKFTEIKRRARKELKALREDRV